MKEIKGNLITLAQEGNFDLIGHGCNCFCRMGRGIAPQIKEAFPEAWRADEETIKGDIKKLGNFTKGLHYLGSGKSLVVLNIYSQYGYDSSAKPIDYDALTLALRKINHIYKGRRIGLPLIGAGLAGGNWDRIRTIIIEQLKDMDVTVVHYEK